MAECLNCNNKKANHIADGLYLCPECEGKDVFEYSVFGSPQQKIGKFANQKSLGEWS